MGLQRLDLECPHSKFFFAIVLINQQAMALSVIQSKTELIM
jgi:hypothetical protein